MVAAPHLVSGDESHQAPWQGRLRLGFEQRNGRTCLVDRYHQGPLRVQSPFYPEDDVCHLYLLHPPGGMVGGDQLTIEATVATGAHALITTPASTKFYRSNGQTAHQQQQLTVQPGAVLEWLPQDTILFAGSRARLTTRVDLEGDAVFIGWEMLCLGRPAAGESYADDVGGHCRQWLELWRDGAPLFIERGRYGAEDALLNQAWGMQGYEVSATLVATAAGPEALAQVRSAIEALALPAERGLLSCTLINDVLVCRLLAHQGETARLSFSHLWQALRPLLPGRPACPPRIWNT